MKRKKTNQKNRKEAIALTYQFDVQCLIAGENLAAEEINQTIAATIPGDCLLVVGTDTLIKIHFHTNQPWRVLEYGAALGDLHDIVIDNMARQAAGLQGEIKVKSRKTAENTAVLFFLKKIYCLFSAK